MIHIVIQILAPLPLSSIFFFLNSCSNSIKYISPCSRVQETSAICHPPVEEKRTVAGSARNAVGCASSPLHGSHLQGDTGTRDFLPLGKLSLFQHILLLMVCFWTFNSMTLGTVCTYICRNNVYVAQNRHFLKAVNLKVKLIQLYLVFIFSLC